ncbi:hypothetical protein CDL12_14520 [Handroanthus impetiginosus]|uniref:Uncharacterized protein n=1 Tax=Handroanthus impetiginosus TaxID=429701 RepID=A0A2G9H5S0_9LAMI|nr:hypothetical protein CDL12_14520 [Handroanthus impetiginosus]
MGSPVITPEDVLETLMNDGTIDALRLKIINQLKANEELKSNTIKMVEQSKVLNTSGAEKQTKRELFDALRQELETPVLEKASRSVWELILDQNGLGKEINNTVERVFCQLSGREPPLFPTLTSEVQTDKDKEVTPSTSSKKRSFNDMSKEEGDGVANESANASVVPDNTTTATSPNSRK